MTFFFCTILLYIQLFRYHHYHRYIHSLYRLHILHRLPRPRNLYAVLKPHRNRLSLEKCHVCNKHLSDPPQSHRFREDSLELLYDLYNRVFVLFRLQENHSSPWGFFYIFSKSLNKSRKGFQCAVSKLIFIDNEYCLVRCVSNRLTYWYADAQIGLVMH